MNELQWIDIKELKGFTLVGIVVSEDKETVTFYRKDGKKVVMTHQQDCCEQVWLEDIDGELEDLIGSPLLEAEETSREAGSEPSSGDFSATWTYYKLGTAKGSVSLRWVGESNGYYSEEVDIWVEEIK